MATVSPPAPVVAAPTGEEAAHLAKLDTVIAECRGRLAAADTAGNKAELTRLVREKQETEAGKLGQLDITAQRIYKSQNSYAYKDHTGDEEQSPAGEFFGG